MNKILLGLALCTAFTANAQQRLELDVKIKGLPDGDTVLLIAPLARTVDTAYVKNNHFSYHLDMSKGGTTYILQVGVNAKEDHGTVLYLEAGKMNITGDGPFFKNATYTGSPFVADWVDISKNIMGADTTVAAKDIVSQKYGDAVKIGDEDAAKQAKAEWDKLSQWGMKASLDWVNKHPNSGAASFLLNAYLYDLPKDQLKDLVMKLGPDVRKTFTIQKMMTGLIGGGETMTSLLNKEAPAIVLNDANGKQVSLADFKGKYVLVDFWASWCKPCRAATPSLVATYEKFKNKGFTVLSVSLDDKKDKWLQAIAEDKMTWPQVSDLKGGESPVAAKYGVMAIPASFLVDPSGNVIALGAFGEKLDEKLLEVLK